MLCAIIFAEDNIIVGSPIKLAKSQVQIYGCEFKLGMSAYQD